MPGSATGTPVVPFRSFRRRFCSQEGAVAGGVSWEWFRSGEARLRPAGPARLGRHLDSSGHLPSLNVLLLDSPTKVSPGTYTLPYLVTLLHRCIL